MKTLPAFRFDEDLDSSSHARGHRAIEEAPTPRVLLLDDDILFCRLMTRVGAKRNIPVTSCQTVEQFEELARWVPFDVAILDYYLEGEAIAPELAQTLRKATIVISNNEQELTMDERWPASVKISISKTLGISAILEAARAITLF